MLSGEFRDVNVHVARQHWCSASDLATQRICSFQHFCWRQHRINYGPRRCPPSVEGIVAANATDIVSCDPPAHIKTMGDFWFDRQGKICKQMGETGCSNNVPVLPEIGVDLAEHQRSLGDCCQNYALVLTEAAVDISQSSTIPRHNCQDKFLVSAQVRLRILQSSTPRPPHYFGQDPFFVVLANGMRWSLTGSLTFPPATDGHRRCTVGRFPLALGLSITTTN
mmetsp:Transcript_101097/g.195591  ORF Transcript_101097/g.195591 Transcript_101097/m.195591 type:complete len:223 (-) Transcript_101097:60-728(-)